MELVSPAPSATPKIPFNRLEPLGRELEYVVQAISEREVGPASRFVRACEDWLTCHYKAAGVLLVPSATAALEMIAMLLDLGPGDEVIMPSFTFVSTANAMVLRGARPCFVDVLPGTMNIDPEAVAAAITPRTKAILPVHYAGVGCELERLGELARANDLVLVEDAAQAIGASRGGRRVGSAGALAALSFHETKNVGCGEGGALIVNDPAYLERAHMLRDKGTNRKAFLGGSADKYTWVDIGSSFSVSGLTAAFLLGQLEKLDELTARRRAIHARYMAAFQDLEDRGAVRLPRVEPLCDHNAHIFFMFLRSTEERERLIAYLASLRIQAVFHYVPLHTAPFARAHLEAPPSLPVTEDLAHRLLRLPLYNAMTNDEVDRVIHAVHGFFEG
ncbi:dTDP-4-amino-4,6-dideoxygalactose transaminase [Phenylobacterium sp. LH3H17]|uniref:dTDP-4-amino-4,6-dideoxygalactose transaminase n=1 Tax=Phenylobacterium sp. LH3H17 TaxID=2903901 RepID=UPI0020C9F4AC|nr:dTDP-4-amino-4,6-dideoxygalactose transaminase [Phenylobacterium sp. LH3H17]UTP40365.1 dTDP-4-amino-4,6-dideoxygalactose transaminase [Phenylobacterium sp. LH3H17]